MGYLEDLGIAADDLVEPKAKTSYLADLGISPDEIQPAQEKSLLKQRRETGPYPEVVDYLKGVGSALSGVFSDPREQAKYIAAAFSEPPKGVDLRVPIDYLAGLTEQVFGMGQGSIGFGAGVTEAAKEITAGRNKMKTQLPADARLWGQVVDETGQRVVPLIMPPYGAAVPGKVEFEPVPSDVVEKKARAGMERVAEAFSYHPVTPGGQKGLENIGELIESVVRKPSSAVGQFVSKLTGDKAWGYGAELATELAMFKLFHSVGSDLLRGKAKKLSEGGGKLDDKVFKQKSEELLNQARKEGFDLNTESGLNNLINAAFPGKKNAEVRAKYLDELGKLRENITKVEKDKKGNITPKERDKLLREFNQKVMDIEKKHISPDDTVSEGARARQERINKEKSDAESVSEPLEDRIARARQEAQNKIDLEKKREKREAEEAQSEQQRNRTARAQEERQRVIDEADIEEPTPAPERPAKGGPLETAEGKRPAETKRTNIESREHSERSRFTKDKLEKAAKSARGYQKLRKDLVDTLARLRRERRAASQPRPEGKLPDVKQKGSDKTIAFLEKKLEQLDGFYKKHGGTPPVMEYSTTNKKTTVPEPKPVEPAPKPAPLKTPPKRQGAETPKGPQALRELGVKPVKREAPSVPKQNKVEKPTPVGKKTELKAEERPTSVPKKDAVDQALDTLEKETPVVPVVKKRKGGRGYEKQTKAEATRKEPVDVDRLPDGVEADYEMRYKDRKLGEKKMEDLKSPSDIVAKQLMETGELQGNQHVTTNQLASALNKKVKEVTDKGRKAAEAEDAKLAGLQRVDPETGRKPGVEPPKKTSSGVTVPEALSKVEEALSKIAEKVETEFATKEARRKHRVERRVARKTKQLLKKLDKEGRVGKKITQEEALRLLDQEAAAKQNRLAKHKAEIMKRRKGGKGGTKLYSGIPVEDMPKVVKDFLRKTKGAVLDPYRNKELFDKTGYWLGQDGFWRKEWIKKLTIDRGKLNKTKPFGGSGAAFVKDIVKTKDGSPLPKELDNTIIALFDRSAYSNKFNKIFIDAKILSNPKELVNHIMHEIQHRINAYHQAFPGSSYDNIAKNLKRQRTLDEHMKEIHKRYATTPGEMEARVFAERALMTEAQRKAKPPWEHLDEMLKREGLPVEVGLKLYSNIPIDEFKKFFKRIFPKADRETAINFPSGYRLTKAQAERVANLTESGISLSTVKQLLVDSGLSAKDASNALRIFQKESPLKGKKAGDTPLPKRKDKKQTWKAKHEDHGKVLDQRKKNKDNYAPPIYENIAKSLVNLAENIGDLPKWISSLKTGTRIIEKMGKPVVDSFYHTMNEAKEGQVRQVKADQTRLKEIRKIKGLTAGSPKRIGVAMIHDRSPRGRATLEKMGIKVQELTDPEIRARGLLEKFFKEKFEEVNQARIDVGLEPFTGVTDYVTFIHDLSVLDRFDIPWRFKSTKKIRKLMDDIHPSETGFRFGKKASSELTLPLETNVFKLADIYGRAAVRHSKLTPTIGLLQEHLRGFKHPETGKWWRLEDKAPNAYKYLRDWLDYEAGVRPTGGYDFPKLEKFAMRASKNLVAAFLAGSIRTVVIQPTAALFAAAQTHPKYSMAAAKFFTSRATRKFVERNSNLITREYDIVQQALADAVLSKNPAELHAWATKKTLSGVKYADMATSGYVWYMKYLEGRGLGLNRKAASRRANLETVKSQGSAASHDLPKVQKVSLGRAVTLFQTFNINQLGAMVNDIMGFNRPVDARIPVKRRLAQTVAALTMIEAVNVAFEEGADMESPLPAPFLSLYKSLAGGKSIPGSFGSVFKEVAEYIPVIGGAVKFGGSFGGPIADTIEKLLDLQRRTEGREMSDKEVDYMVELLFYLGGAPGSRQFYRYKKSREKGYGVVQSLLGPKYKPGEKAGRNTRRARGSGRKRRSRKRD
jgi:hypothetical protein